MKMITAIINKKDAGKVCSALIDGGFYFTKTATSGGFLTIGNTTLIIGVEDDKVSFIGSRPYYEFSNGELHKNNPSNSMLSERKIKQ